MNQIVATGNTIFVGTKRVKSAKMTRAEYNFYRGWKCPPEENPDDAGYLVEYLDGGKPNDERHAGYISWSPADTFELSYKPEENSTFQERLIHEKADLDSRLSKLQGLFKSGKHVTLPDDQVGLLNTQVYLMERMSDILGRRIALL